MMLNQLILILEALVTVSCPVLSSLERSTDNWGSRSPPAGGVVGPSWK